MPCLNDPALTQVSAIDEEGLRNRAAELRIDEESLNELVNIVSRHFLSDTEVTSVLEAATPDMATLSEIRNGSEMQNVTD